MIKIINFRGDVSDVSTEMAAVILFSNPMLSFWDTRILYILICMIRISDFRGDLTDVLAKTKTLPGSQRADVHTLHESIGCFHP